MESWGHFENRSKAALGNKKARFHCARLHLHCSHVMRLYRTNLIINNLKERTNHGKPLKPAWRETPILYGEDARRFMKRMEIHIPEHTRSISDGEFCRRIG